MDSNRIVANGRENLLNDPANQKKIDDAVQTIRMRYKQEMKTGGMVAKIRLWFKMQKEIRASIESIAPSRGCYTRQ